jgi:flagellar biosynthesis/type III secretory pathway protein FliH
MVNINQSEDKNEELKLSPLGTDEINSVIKSFKNSTFNQEELYKKDEKKFVKKTLFDLAKESERISSEESQSKTDNSGEENFGTSEEIFKDTNQNDEPENIHSINDLDEHNNKEKEEDHINSEIDEPIKSDEVSEEKVNDKHEKSDEVLDENINKNVKELNEKNPDTNSAETNKIEYEEKTLEALDSVREAVTKSLEENIETQNEEIKNIAEVSKNTSNEVISEISLINTLFKNIREISNEEIENVVKSKVIELAEDVIGYQIEKFPDKFLKKIKNSINEIKSINKDIKIYLNDKDFELLNKFIENNKLEITFKLELDPSLGRGDFTIDMGGVIQAIKYKKVIE